MICVIYKFDIFSKESETNETLKAATVLPSNPRKNVNCYLPERVFLVREELEVLVSQLHWRQSLQLQVGPAMHKVGQVHKGV